MTDPQPETLAYTLHGFAGATGLSLSSIKIAIREGALVPSYVKSKPLIPKKEGERWLDSLPAGRAS